jgi:hypothetical protein
VAGVPQVLAATDRFRELNQVVVGPKAEGQAGQMPAIKQTFPATEAELVSPASCRSTDACDQQRRYGSLAATDGGASAREYSSVRLAHSLPAVRPLTLGEAKAGLPVGIAECGIDS